MNSSRPLDLESCADLLDVSRETLAPCAVLLELLERWQRAINLVARSSLRDPWRRHILDSGQLVPFLPGEPGPILDLGSGAGFPGLVVSVITGREVHLVESDQRKAAFLREAARQTGASAMIHARRIEDVTAFPTAALTARALAPLPQLLNLGRPFIGDRTVCLFLKSAAASAELTEAAAKWHMVPQMFQSLSDPRGMVLKLEEVSPCV